MTKFGAAFLAGVMCMSFASASEFSPDKWAVDARQRAEQQEIRSWVPLSAQVLHGKSGMISATVSPIAVQAGLETLHRGGNAADAAATVALTQIATQLGSVVSYAGIMTVLYYDAKSGKISCAQCGIQFISWRERPAEHSGERFELADWRSSAATSERYRPSDFVPGFMAGIEAMHSRFGRVPFGDLFCPRHLVRR